MARKLINMRYVKDILRLKHQNHLSVREIAGSCGLPTSTVGDYLQRAEAAGLTWPLPEGISDAELAQRLLQAGRVQPDRAAQPSRCPTGPRFRSNCGAKASRCNCCGRNITRPTPRVTSAASSASCIGTGPRRWTRCCARFTNRARSSSWIGPD